MGKLFDSLVQFFEDDDWSFERDSEHHRLTMRVTGKNASFHCFARTDEDKQFVLFYSVLGLNAAEERRMAMAEFIARANYGLSIGNFELDFSDGEIRYKTSIDMEGGELTSDMINNLVSVNVRTAYQYFPGVTNVLFANMAPAEAIERVENPTTTA